MTKIMVIVKKDIRETLRSRAFYFSTIIAMFVVVMLVMSLQDSISTLIKPGASQAEVTAMVQPLIGASMFLLCFMVMMLFCMYVNSYAVIIEKIKRSIESLLCTPLSLRQVWLGKSLAVFLPSVVLGLVCTLGITGAMMYVIASKSGYWILPGIAPMIATMIMIPVIVFLISTIAVILQLLIVNIRLVNIVFIAVIFGVGFSLSNFLSIASSSWGIIYVSLAVAAVLALLVYYLSRLLTKEKIILSSKG
jgi:ABC-2 type transport system permease protein